MRPLFVFALSIATLLAATSAPAAAPLSADQVAKLKAIDLTLVRAGNFYTQKKFKDAAAAVDEANKSLTDLATNADKDFHKILEARWTKLKAAHAALELEGTAVAPIAIPSPSEKPAGEKPAPGTKPAPGAKPAPRAGGKISFMNQVLPLLAAKCGRCHMSDTKGGFGFNTFAALQKGSKDGIVFAPGKSQGARLTEVIETGDMPRGGGKVSPAELAMLKAWIDQGAVFDGKDPTANLATSVPKSNTPEPPAMKLEVLPPTGKETVSFSRDLAPVLAANCTGCHGDQNPGGRLNLDNFTALIRGGESGVPYFPGNAAESLLVKKLSGKAGAQMPLKKKPLDAAIIAKFEKWVAEGGKFDGQFGAAQRVERIAEIAKAQAAGHDELSKQRETLAERKWRNALSDVQSQKFETKNVLSIGAPANGQTVETLANAAEQQIPVVAKLLGVQAETPFVKGRMTLIGFKNQIDLEEFMKTNDGRSRANDLAGYWHYDGIDSVMGILPPANPKEYNLNALLGQQIASLYVNQLGQRTPTWFADGVGRVVAAKIDGKDPRIARWDSLIGQAIGAAKPEAILGSTGAAEELSALSYGVVRTQFMSNSAAFGLLLQALRRGDDFDVAVAKAYKATPQQIVTNYCMRRGK